MANRKKQIQPVRLPAAPQELKELATFLANRGYTLAFPFDNIRLPGYVGSFNERGQEIIIDNGKCLKNVPRNPAGKTVLGNFARSSKFSLKSFLSVFGNVLGLNLGAMKTKSVSLNFPSPILQTEFLTEMDLEDAIAELKPACRQRVTDPENFVVLQVLQTNSLEYKFELGKNISADAKAKLNDRLAALTKIGEVQATVQYESDRSFTVTVTTTVTIGYKTARVQVSALSAKEIAGMRVAAAATGGRSRNA